MSPSSPQYPTLTVTGQEDSRLIVHMCFEFKTATNMVEFYATGGVPVILSQEQFEDMVKWVGNQFDLLSRHVPTIH